MTVNDAESNKLILSPDLSSSLIIRQHEKSCIRFYCYSPMKRRIELWTNLYNGKWTAIPFTQQSGSSSTDYTLQISTWQLPLGTYEYTLRFSGPLVNTNKDHVDCWFWYGKPGQNGTMHIVQQTKDNNTPQCVSVPQLRFVANIADLWHFRTQSEEASFSLGEFHHSIHRYVCLIQKGSTWITPVTGANNFQNRNTNEKCQLLLYQDTESGDIHLWMSLCQYADCHLSFEADNNSIRFHHTPGKDAHLLIVSTSNKKRFADMIQDAFDYYHSSIQQERSSRSAEMLLDNNILLEKLGYCTWNAFGQNVNIENINSALDSLKTHNIPVEYLIIDDGWQSVTKKCQMARFDACPLKFPGGLRTTIAQLKADYSFIQCIGVWHALWGYWNGIDENFASENSYNWVSNRQNHHEIGIIDNPKAFYNTFYRFLNDSGVDYVKVDNQGSFQELSSKNSEQNNTSLWDDFRLAMVDSADAFLQNGVLHCMSLTPHVLFDPILSQKTQSIFRNSDDFFPDEKESHAWHIYANAMNSLLTAHYPAIGDWDMFQSDHPFAEYHASSRAISGGPIYLTDMPGKHNVGLIYKLVAETKHAGYTILRSSQVPQPTFDTVFNNSMDSQSIIALYNVHQEQRHENRGPKELITVPKYGVCGFWNTGPHDKLAIVTSALFCFDKFTTMTPMVAYVVSGPDQGKIGLLEHHNDDDDDDSSSCSSSSWLPKLPIQFMQSQTKVTTTAMMARVHGYGSTLVTVSAIQCTGILSMACLGLIDKLNGTVCILRTEVVLYDQPCRWYATFEVRLSHKSSSCGFWIKTHDDATSIPVGLMPARVRVDRQALDVKDWTWCTSTSLLKVNMLAVPSRSNGSMNSTDKDDDFIVQIDIK